MRTKIFLSTILALGLGILNTYASMTITVESDEYVKGYTKKAAINVFVETDTYDFHSLNLKFMRTEGVTPIFADAVFNTNIFSPNGTPTCAAIGVNWRIQYSGPATMTGKGTIPTTTKVLFATAYVTLDASLSGSVVIPIEFTTASGWDPAQGSTGSQVNYKPTNDDPKKITLPSSVTIQILESFNFATNTGAKVTLDEDAPAKTIPATDTGYFNCQVWTGAAMIEQASPLPAQFTVIDFAASGLVATGNENSAGVPEYDFLDPSENESGFPVGCFAIDNDNKIYYEPGENFYGQFDLHYTVASTYPGVTGTAQGVLTFVVNPVNDPPTLDPELAVSKTAIEETETFDITFTPQDVETKEGLVYKVYLSKDNKLAGGETPVFKGSAAANEEIEVADLFFAYDSISHTDASDSQPRYVIVTITDQATDGTEAVTATFVKELTLTDKDRPAPAPEISPATIADRTVADGDLTIVFTKPDDPDGDAITGYYWYLYEGNTESEPVASGLATADSVTIAKENFEREKEYVFEVACQTQPFGVETKNNALFSNSFAILNSPPVSLMNDPHRVFVQKSDEVGHQAQSTVTLKVEDFDGLKGETLLAWISTPADKGNISTIGANEEDAVELNLPLGSSEGTLDFTYTVNSPEEDESEDYDSFTITVKDSGGASVEIPFTVDYLVNPPPTFTWTLLSSFDRVTKDEVEAEGRVFPEVTDGNPTVFYVKVKAQDSDAVKPAGIADITLEAPGLGEVERVFFDKGDPIPREGTTRAAPGTAVAIFAVSTLGYNTIVNAGEPPFRAENANFSLTIKVTDVFAAAITNTDPDNGPLVVTIEDVDQPPPAPDKIELTFEGEVLVASTSPINALASGEEDKDGDTILYTYQWYYLDGGEGEPIKTEEPGESLTDRNALKKGNVIYCEAKSVTNPYNDLNDLKDSAWFKSAELTVVNSAPEALSEAVIAFAAGDYNEGGNEGETTIANLVGIETFVTDIDVEDEVDTLVFTIVPDSLEFDLNPGDLTKTEIEACLTIDSKSKEYGDDVAITFDPVDEVVDFYGKFTFEIEATDESGESAKRKVSFEIAPVNDPPTIKASDLYVMPDDRGKLFQAWFKVDMGGVKGYEDNQSIADQTVALVDQEQAGLFKEGPTLTAVATENSDELSTEGQWLYLSFTLNEEVALGTQIEITLQVTDDGAYLDFNGGTQNATGAESDPVTIKIVVGATPWYPIYEIVCVDPENHKHDQVLVEILDDADNLAGKAIILNKTDGGFMLMPKDYYRNGYAGFLPNTAFDLKVYDYALSAGGKGALCFATADQPLLVPNYGLPGAPDQVTCTAPANGGRVYTFTVNTPVASSFVLEIVKGAEGEEVPFKTIKQKYEPDADGIIIPATEVKVELPDGRYLATVYGLNPLYQQAVGEQVYPDPKWSEPVIVNLGATEINNANWDTAEGFNPPNGTINYIATGELSDITFSWPDAGTASSYQLTVFNSDGSDRANLSTTENSITVTRIPEGNYTWVVKAVAANGQVVDASPYLSLRFQGPTDIPVISEIGIGVNAGELVLTMPTGDATGQRYEMIYYDKYGNLHQFFANAPAVGAGNVITFPGVTFVSGSWILLRPAGSTVDFEVYIIQ